MWEQLEVVIRSRPRHRQGHTLRGAQTYESGYDIANTREYQMGDSPRGVNLLHFLKYGDLVITERFPDRRCSILFLIDVSASEGLGNVRSKKGASLDAVNGLGIACMSQGHIVRCLTFTDQIEYETPFTGSRQIWDDEIIGMRLTVPRGRETNPVPVFEEAWDMASGSERVDLVCIVSDFLFPDEYKHRLGSLLDASDVIALVITDPMETEVPPLAGTFVLRDVESGETVYASAMNTEDPSAYLESIGIDRCHLSTRDDEFQQFARLQEFFEERAEEGGH